MNSLDKDYQALLKKVLEKGIQKGDRTGTGTLSLFGETIRHDMSKGFPLLTTKKMALKTMMTELKWFLKGDTNIKYLVDNNCNIWNGDCYQAYSKWNDEANRTSPFEPVPKLSEEDFIKAIKIDDEFALKWGELGPIYGKQWRDWSVRSDGSYDSSIDQISNLIYELKTNPNSRRHIVSAWNVSDLDEMTLPPCHYGFQCFVNNGKLSLMWNQRSADLFLGVPFNIASYGTLLLLLCEETGLEAGELIGNLGDVHLYSNHLDQAAEQILREPYELPKFAFFNVDILNGEFNYSFTEYKSHPSIKAPLSN